MEKEAGASDEEEEIGGVADRLNNLRMETTGAEEEPTELFTAVLEM